MNILIQQNKAADGLQSRKKELVDSKIELMEANDGKGVFLIQPRFRSDRLYSYFGLKSLNQLIKQCDQFFTHKREVGERLALIALAKNCGLKNTRFSGPLYQKAFTEKSKVHVKFDQKLFTIMDNR